jgi:hypothetical protein
MRDQLAQRTFKEFIIEAGAGELDHNFGWNSFFTIESNDTGTVESKVTFLEARFECPEEAINAALAAARRRIDRQVMEASQSF